MSEELLSEAHLPRTEDPNGAESIMLEAKYGITAPCRQIASSLTSKGEVRRHHCLYRPRTAENRWCVSVFYHDGSLAFIKDNV